MCVKWKDAGQGEGATAAINACVQTEFASATNLHSLLPYGHNAVARAVEQMLAIPGRELLEGSLIALQLAYVLVPVGFVWGMALSDELPTTCRPCAAWLILCTSTVAWIASVIGATVWASRVMDTNFWLNNLGAWQAFESVLQPETSQACSINGSTTFFQYEAMIPMTVSFALVVLALGLGGFSGSEKDPCCPRAPPRCTRSKATEVGCCGDACDHWKSPDQMSLLGNPEVASTEMWPALAFWMRLCALVPLCVVHATALILAVQAIQSDILTMDATVNLVNQRRQRVITSASVQYTVTNGLACLSTTDGAALAHGYASKDCFTDDGPRQLALLNVANNTAAPGPDASSVVLPDTMPFAKSVVQNMLSNVVATAVCIVVLLMLTFCNVRQGNAFHFFKCWGPVALIVLAGASIAAAATAQVARDTLGVLPRLPFLEILALPAVIPTSAGAKALSQLVQPFGLPLNNAGTAVTTVFSPALEIVRTTHSLTAASAGLTTIFAAVVIFFLCHALRLRPAGGASVP